MPLNLLARWRGLGWPLRLGLIAAAFLVLYTAFGFWGLPPLARSVVQSRLGDALGRTVTVDKVSYNPYSHRLALEGLVIREQNSTATFASVQEVVADVSLFSLIKLAGVMEEVFIRRPYVFIHHLGEGTYNFSDILAGSGEKARAEEKKGEEAEAIFPFVVNNFHIQNGRIVIRDDALDSTHLIEAVNLTVPYTSSLPEDRQEAVKPTLSAIVNGKRLTLTGETRPFADKLTTEFKFSIWGKDLVSLWPYVPAPKEIVLTRGLFSCAGVLSFERTEGILPRLAVRGDFYLDDVSLDGPDGQPLGGFESLLVKLSGFSLFKRLVALETVSLSVPYLHLSRLADGSLDWLGLAAKASGGSASSRDAPPPAASADSGDNGAEATNQTAAPAFRVTAETVEVRRGFFRFTDASVSPAFEAVLAPMDLALENLDTSPGANATFVFTLGTRDSVMAGARGTFSPVPLAARVQANASGVVLADYRAYYDSLLPLDLASGRARTSFVLTLDPTAGPVVSGLDLEVSGVALKKRGKAKVAGFDLFAVRNATVSAGEKKAEIERLVLSGAYADVVRTKAGEIDPLNLFTAEQGPAAKTARTAPPAGDADSGQGGPGFTVLVRRAALENCSARFTDKAVPGRAQFKLDKVYASLDNVRSDMSGEMPLAARAVFQGSAKLAAKGRLRLKPEVKAVLDLDVRGLPLAAGLPYLPQNLPVLPASGFVSAKGRAEAALGKSLSYAWAGDVSLAKLLLKLARTDERLVWLDLLAVNGIRAQGPEISARVEETVVSGLRVEDLDHGRDMAGLASLRVAGVDYVQAGPSVGVESVDLDGPFALIVKQANATNVGRVASALKGDRAGQPAAEPVAAPETAAPQAEADATAPEGAGKQGMDVEVRRIAVRNGAFSFRDESVNPAFSTSLGNATAMVENLSLVPGRSASLALNATFADQAPLAVEAGFDPTLTSLDSRIRVSIRNMSMTGLSPYTVKHLSHPIETGKLRADVRMNIKGEELDGDNSVLIEHFELGPDMDSPDAVGVPIGLALALLRDMDGNVALDVPVSGKLSDPEFSLGQVILNAIVNVLTKIVTSPFAALGSVLQGGEEDSFLGFAPGGAQLDATASDKLARVAEAMAKRPGLKLEVAGFVAPATDGPALTEKRFLNLVKRSKYLELKEDGQAPARVEDVVLGPDEYADYLEEAYVESDAPKETNFLGMVKVPPVPEMEEALRAGVRADKSDLLELATERAQAARGRLVDLGVEPERVFIKYGTFDAPPELEESPPARAELMLK